MKVATRKGAPTPDDLDELIAWGAKFDHKPDGSLSLGREGGHSAARILHAQGDADHGKAPSDGRVHLDVVSCWRARAWASVWTTRPLRSASTSLFRRPRTSSSA